MKMAEKAVVLPFQNNCETINSNGVDILNDINHKTANDITENPNINKPEDKPLIENNEKVNVMSQEDAVEEFLAGEVKNEFQEDLLNIDGENEDIVFKNENVIMDCQEEEKIKFADNQVASEFDNDKSDTDFIENSTNLDDQNNLTKMHIMEDVREAGNEQPSSPGHAEQCTDKKPIISCKIIEEHVGHNIGSQQNNNDGKKIILTNLNENDKEDEKVDTNMENNHVNEDNSNTSSSDDNKRKSDDQGNDIKRLRLEIQDNFFARDRILNEFIELADCNSVDQFQMQTEQILAEIKTLNELAKEKEKEWNNIIYLKKMKEELLLRMQRRKQVVLNSEKSDNCEILNENQFDNERLKANQNQSILKANLTNPHKNLKLSNQYNSSFEKSFKQRHIVPKNQSYELNGDYKQGKRPVLDVQSIIADYRQRHPETVPRRGRRIRNTQGENAKNSNNILNFSSLALGSGSQVHHNVHNFDVNNELGMILNSMEGSKSSNIESLMAHANEPSFRDMLVQFAKLTQNERNELFQNVIKPPPPYPEVTVHPVPTTTTIAPTNSLLHGILTKNPSKTNSKTSFSPTLARLLTAPERSNMGNCATNIQSQNNNNSNMSISEILSTSKARNEITITPVSTNYEIPKNKENRAMDEDESEDCADRLVIDESNETNDSRGRGDNSSDGDEVPQCQGCNQKSALFVCAGCGNQWYCSRDCQVAAWDEHSEVCSG